VTVRRDRAAAPEQRGCGSDGGINNCWSRLQATKFWGIPEFN
jgi:hypothetical protein